MYAWLWRNLPGPWAVRAFLLLLLLAAIVILLFGVVFPAVEPHLPFSDSTTVQPHA